MRVPEASSRVLARVGPRMRRSDLATSAAPGDVISPAVFWRPRPSGGLQGVVGRPKSDHLTTVTTSRQGWTL